MSISLFFFWGGQKRSNTVDCCEGVQSWRGHANGHQRPETDAWEMRWKDSQKIIPEAHQNGARDFAHFLQTLGKIICIFLGKGNLLKWLSASFCCFCWAISYAIGFRIQNAKTLYAGWWFQVYFIFTPIWGRFPIWLIFFKWVETTNQYACTTEAPYMFFQCRTANQHPRGRHLGIQRWSLESSSNV